MLTIFAIPKAFKGQFDAIQRNAIGSWCRLDPKPEVILFGDDEGTSELAKDLGIRHIPEIDRNEYGTPLMPAIFNRGQEAASNPIVAYVNSDIILGQDFMVAVRALAAAFGRQEFLGVGRKTSIRLTERIDFDDPDWETKLRQQTEDDGYYVTFDSDFFIFPKGMFMNIPPFAIGRCYWSSWLMYNARSRAVPMVDVTRAVVSIEPFHDYTHAKSTGGMSRLSGVEFRTNKALFKGCRYYTTVNANQVLTPDGLVRAPFYNPIISQWVRISYWTYFLMKGDLYPYSMPLILVGRGIYIATLKVAASVRRVRRRFGRRHSGITHGAEIAAGTGGTIKNGVAHRR